MSWSLTRTKTTVKQHLLGFTIKRVPNLAGKNILELRLKLKDM